MIIPELRSAGYSGATTLIKSEDSTKLRRMFVFRSGFEDGAILQRSLWLKNITPEDLKSTFTCVVKNAVGKARKHTTFSPTGRELCGETHKHSAK